MEDSIFTKIIKGEIPCYKIYEDDSTLAFLDIEPARYGHTLVVSKKQIDQYMDLPDEDYAALWQTVQMVARRLREVMKAERVAVSVVGTDVPHTHIHLIPFTPPEKHYKDATSPKPSQAELAALAEKLRF